MAKNDDLPELDAGARKVAAEIINALGSGGHPYADERTLPFFKRAYLRKLITKHDTTIRENLRGDALPAYDRLRTALEL